MTTVMENQGQPFSSRRDFPRRLVDLINHGRNIKGRDEAHPDVLASVVGMTQPRGRWRSTRCTSWTASKTPTTRSSRPARPPMRTPGVDGIQEETISTVWSHLIGRKTL